jgi:hypothetical protein
LNGVANPSGMASLQYRLIDDGRSMFLSADNGKGGRAECIVTLPDRVTEDGAEASISSRWSGSAHGCGRRLQSGQHD